MTFELAKQALMLSSFRLRLDKDPSEHFPPASKYMDVSAVRRLLKGIKHNLGILENEFENRVPQEDPGTDPRAKKDITSAVPIRNLDTRPHPKSTKKTNATCAAVQTDVRKENGDLELKQVYKCTDWPP